MPFDMNRFANDPWTQIGLGILSSNTPGAAPLQAIGQGGLMGLQNMERMAAAKEQSEYRKLQAEQLKAEMERAKAEAARQAELEQRAQEAIQADPTLAPFYALGGSKGALDAQMKRYGRQLEMPDILYDRNYKERQLALDAQKANQPDFGMVNALLPDGTTTYGRTSPQGSFEVQTPQGWAPAPAGTQVYKSQAQGGIGDIGGLSKTMNTNLQNAYISDENYLATLDQVMPLLREENFGIPGSIRALYRDIKGQGGAFDAWIGGVQQDATLQGGKDDEKFTYSKWFDESLQNLSATDMLMNTIAYMKAKSLDSGGRVSDKDIENQKRALGFERGLSNINDLRARLEQDYATIQKRRDRNAARLQNPMFPSSPEPKKSQFSNLWGD